MGKKLINGIFVGIAAVVLTLGLVRTLFFPKNVNEYENRYAEKVAPLTASGYLDGSFQEQMDAALSDQVDPGQTFKDMYNRATSQVLLSALRYVNTLEQKRAAANKPPVPTPTPVPTPVPTQTPPPAPEPTAAATESPSAEPVPTGEPSAEPEPTAAPTAGPTATPEPTPAPEPTPEPMPTPEPTPTPDPSTFRYIKLGSGINLFGPDNLVYGTSRPDWIQGSVSARADQLNVLIALHPETEFYAYYVEKDTDINFETGEKDGAYEMLVRKLDVPEEHVGRFRVDSFADFAASFYKTDHHWSYDGSYRGYLDLLTLLGVEDEPLKPLETVEVGTFSGSKGAGRGFTQFTETFYAYRFEFPSMKVKFNGSSVGDYGHQRSGLAGNLEKLGYGTFYGGDGGEIILSTGNTERDNILLLGESYDNAVLKLLASHFQTTYAVDLRYYQRDMEKEFHLAEYLEKNEISKVLFIGNVDYYLEKVFVPED